MDIKTLIDAKDEIEAFGKQQIGSFEGFKIIENSMLPENEILIVCGSKTYRWIIETRQEQAGKNESIGE